uniref:Secreted protein n=1 Tax=Mesocestoides corti TaxID=53468 RepID=A0A5K3EU96_MESCO
MRPDFPLWLTLPEAIMNADDYWRSVVYSNGPMGRRRGMWLPALPLVFLLSTQPSASAFAMSCGKAQAKRRFSTTGHHS